MPMRAAIRVVVLAACVLTVFCPSAVAGKRLQKAIWGPIDAPSFKIYDDLGIKLVQIVLPWHAVAPEKPADPLDPNDPAYRWPQRADDALRLARKHHMKVLVEILGSPPWANGGNAWNWAPSPRAFGEFARVASLRYRAVDHWMIWGEPDRHAMFMPSSPMRTDEPPDAASKAVPKRYARILDAAYGQIKRESKRNLVIGGSTFTLGEIRPLAWVRYMRLPSGRPPRLDIYAHNAFTARTPDYSNPPSPDRFVDFSDLGRFARHVNRYLGKPRHRKVPLHIAEWAIPTGPDSEFNFWTSPKTQARWIRKAMRIARRDPDIFGLGWVHLQDEPASVGHHRMRTGLLEASGRRKPGYYAFRAG